MGRKNQARKKTVSKEAVSSYCRDRAREGVFLLLMALGVLLFLALVSYHRTDPSWSYATSATHVLNVTGRVGAFVSDVLLYVFGYSAYLFPVLVCYGAWVSFRDRAEQSSLKTMAVRVFRVFGFFVLLLTLAGLVAIHTHISGDLPFQAGGIVGVSIAGMMSQWFNKTGASIWLLLLALFALSAITGHSIFACFEKTGRCVECLFSGFKRALQAIPWASFGRRCADVMHSLKASCHREPKPAKEPPVVMTPKVVQPIKETKPLPAEPEAPNKGFQRATQVQASAFIPSTDTVSGKRIKKAKNGSLPSLALLDKNKVVKKTTNDMVNLNQQGEEVEQRLADFGVSAQVMGIYPGPVVTRFELQLSPGTKVSKVSNLAKDLARSLSVMGVRVVEVIPGKTTIGLELPNDNRETVILHDVLDSKEFSEGTAALPLALGKDIAGVPVVVDLAKMPHLLVAGTTGSGKSVGLNAMLLSLLYRLSPDELRLIMIDPKMLELSVYEGVPHLLTPVVTDMKDAAKALRWCVAEMERRYKLMASLGVRNIAGFNTKVQEAIDKGEPLLDSTFTAEQGPARRLETLPKIVVLADEFADMMVVVGKKVETLIARLAQKARAAGIHLILATQRPSVDVITGLIKANIPTRIAFQVSSRIDSRTILDQQGAEQLLGYGDMLYLAPGTGVPDRVHGCYVADDEVHRVVNYLQQSYDLCYDESILQETNQAGQMGLEDGDAEQDPLYDEAVAFIAKARRVSVSSVQRRFKIGYNRASRIVEAMEAAGVVSEMAQNGGREVLAPPPVEG